MYQDILYEVQDPVAIITMNRPDQLNALTARMMAEMRHAFAAAEKDPAVVGMVLTGAGRALDLLWSARKFTGEEAKELGLAERLVEQGESLQAAIDYIKQLASVVSPTSLKVIKAQVYRHLNMELAEAMDETNTWMAESLKREDFKEGVSSFMEKRLPEFKRLGED